MYLCVCVCIYTKSTSSLWHLANAAADVDVLDVPCGMPRSLAGVAACCCCCLLLLLMSPGVVGVFLARAAIWRNVYDTTQSHATLHKETERERERERGRVGERVGEEALMNAWMQMQITKEREEWREENSAAPKLEATSRSTDATRCSVGSGNR